MTTDTSITRSIDHRTLAIVEHAKKARYDITPCPRCGGPYVRSKTGLAARCLTCGYAEGVRLGRCWSCGAGMVLPDLPTALVWANTNSRADVKAMSPWRLCEVCGGHAAEAPVVRRSWRRCERCKTSLAGMPRPSRGADLCAECRDTVSRQRNRETSRARRARVTLEASEKPDSIDDFQRTDRRTANALAPDDRAILTLKFANGPADDQ